MAMADEEVDIKIGVKRILRKQLIMLVKKLLKGSTKRQRISTSSLTCSLYIQELLNGSPIVCYDLMRMDKNGFISLCQLFKEKGWLSDSKHLTVEEKMAMFLFTISHNLRNRFIKIRFQHSGHTVHRYFHEVL